MENKKKNILLIILNIMLQTDISSPLNTTQIVQIAETAGCPCERKTVLRNIKCLQENGYDILLHPNHRLGFYMASHSFEDWELKLLMDSVYNCSFLTAEQTDCLTEKLKNFAPASSQALLCCNGMPMQNKPEKSYVKYNLDCILHAIKNKAAITFKYGQTNLQGEFIARKKGKQYIVNPYTVILSEQRYYLVCNTQNHDGIGYYRLDRILNPEPLTKSCLPLHKLKGFQEDDCLEKYISKTFYMHSGNEITVTLQCHILSLDDVSEKFGKNCTLEYLNSECFRITGNVIESDGFYYWLLQFAKTVEVVSPPSVRNHLLGIIKEIETGYRPQPL